MNVFFKILFFFACLSAFPENAAAQEPVDPNTPAPAAPVEIRIPHSERTKDNILDSVVDFLLVRFFQKFKNAVISYDFFEIDQNMDLVFTNFKIQVKSPDVQGNILIATAKVDFSEFLAFLKEKKVTVGEVWLKNIKTDLALIRKSDTTEKRRALKFKADEITLEKVQVITLEAKVARSGENQKVKAAFVSARNAALSLTNPVEKFAASFAAARDVVLHSAAVDKIIFSSAEANGKTNLDRNAFLQAVRK